MVEDKIQYVFAGVCLMFVVISAITCLHLIQLRRAGMRIIADIEVHPVSSNRQVEAQPLTTDKVLDKAFPCFTYNTQDIGTTSSSTTKADQNISFNVHQLFQSACGQTCIICLEDFAEQESIIRELPCHHIYHKLCIDRWLITRSLSCPLCKELIVLDEEQEEQSSIQTNQN